MIDGLAWLHLSDFHFIASGDEFSQRVATEALLHDVSARAAAHVPLAFVLVTGDIAHSGHPEEYERASAHLKKLGGVKKQVPGVVA